MTTRSRWRTASLAAVVVLPLVASCTQNPTPGPTPTDPPPTTTPTAPPTTTPVQHRVGFWNLSGDVAAHDPSIIRDGNQWYVFTTGTGLSVTRAGDDLSWGGRRQVFGQAPAWWSSVPRSPGQDPRDAWAPDVKRHGDRVHLFYSLSSFGSQNSAIGHASAPSAAGPFTDHGAVLRSNSSSPFNAIDPELVIDADGQPWLAFGSFWQGIHLTRLRADGATFRPTGSITRIAGRADREIEAPAIIYRDGWYHLFVSHGLCCPQPSRPDPTYRIVFGRSRSITGPYLDRSGRDLRDGGGTVLDAGNDRWDGPGGQDVNEGNVLVRHAYDRTANLAPKLLINGLRWDGGWPAY